MPMPLDQTPVFRQLDSKGRFGRFSYEDGVPVLLAYNLSWFGSQLLSFNPNYSYVALVAAAAGMYFLRVRFPDGLFGILRYYTTPKHFSALAPDVLQNPYPAARRLPERP
jgi:hypothetical protein